MGALNTDEVLQKEAATVLGKDFSGQTGTTLYQSLNGERAAALCLSGGGIRSAAFALGVIQALAVHPRPASGRPVNQAQDSLLAKFHYLSTVSGGGYIGSCLSAWIKREGFATVWKNLVGRPEGPDFEPHMMSWLRDHSNYLTPKVGIASADTWTAIALYLRNLILNWLVLLPLLCLIILLLKAFALFVAWVGKYPAEPKWNNLLIFFMVAGAVGLAIALHFATRNRPTRGASKADQAQFLRRGLLPAGTSSLLFATALALPSSYTLFRDIGCCKDISWLTCLGSLAGLGAVAGVVVYGVSWLAACPRSRDKKEFFLDLGKWIFSGAVYGALIGVGAYIYGLKYGVGWWVFKTSDILLLVFGVPWALMAQLIAEMIFVGLTSYERDSDDDREWLGRAAGWYLVVALCWLALMTLIFVGSDLASGLWAVFKVWLGPLGAASGVITAVLGKSSLSPAQGKAEGVKEISTNVVLAITAPIFIVALLIVISALLDKVLLGVSLTETAFWNAPVNAQQIPLDWPHEATLVVIGIGVAFVLSVGASWFVNVNRFSLHALYRNRIIRAFLGASNPNRSMTVNRFTDFDRNDNLHFHELWPDRVMPVQPPKVATDDWRPFYVVNAALNIVSAKKLAWQQRKAEPFTVSPLHSGSSCVGFRDSAEYGDPEGITIGTAVAISGAAASPNMGYHSSPPLAFLLTLFNVRLGWWLGNPGPKGEKTFKREGPRIAAKPLIYEMLGLTTDDREYVYLSDGGHFENLGLYEMVRRRCRFILISDAGCDGNFAFEDLGNAVRKISLDLGIFIEFEKIENLKSRSEVETEKCCDNRSNDDWSFYAMGKIHYQVADGGGQDGTILYLKPAYRKDAIKNVGVRNYGTANLDFPHQSTANQWFDESQFESYRALGFEIMDETISKAISSLDPSGAQGLEEIFNALV